MTSVFPFAVLLCFSSRLLAAYGASSCPRDWSKVGSRCFGFFIESIPWIDAETFCQSTGGNLASIHSAEEDAFVKDYINKVAGPKAYFWIGGFDAVKDGMWMWSDGSKFNYKIWKAGEPNNCCGGENCLMIPGATANWNDWACTNRASFVCSMDLCV